MKRRNFIAFLGGAAVAWPLGTPAQQAMPVVGFLSVASPVEWNVAPFKQGLGQAGFLENKDVLIEYRWAHGDYSLLSALAVELADRQVAVIAANGVAGQRSPPRPRRRQFPSSSRSVTATR